MKAILTIGIVLLALAAPDELPAVVYELIGAAAMLVILLIHPREIKEIQEG